MLPRLVGVVALAGLVGLCLGQAGQDQTTSVVKYVGYKQGTAWGRPAMLLVVAPRQGAGQMELVVPNKDPMAKKLDPDQAVVDAVNKLKPGDLIQVRTSKLQGKVVLNFIDTYTPKPGEDDPAAFVFVKLVEGKSGSSDTLSVVAKKGDKPSTFVVPNKKNPDNKLAPDEELAAAARQLKEDDIIDLRAQGNTLRYIGPYKALEKAEFVASGEQKVGEVNYMSVQLKQLNGPLAAGDQTVTVLVPAYKAGGLMVRDQEILAKVRAIRPGHMVEYKTCQQDGQTVLLDIRSSTDKAPTSKPADKPKPPAGD